MPYKNKEDDRACRLRHRDKTNAKKRAKYHAAFATNPEPIRATKHAYYMANREKYLAVEKQRQKLKHVEVKSKRDAYRAANRKKVRLQHRESYRKHIEKNRAKDRNRPREVVRKRNRESYARYRKDRVRRSIQWAKDHPAQKLAQCARRKAIKAGATVGDPKAIAAFYEYVYTADEIECFYCHQPVPPDRRHVDHKIPLCRRGPHSLDNLVATCATCNLRKNRLTAEEFLERMRRQAV